MLYNNKYFNQLIIRSDNINDKLSYLAKGIDLKLISKYIDEDIDVKHSNDNIFDEKISVLDYQVEYISTDLGIDPNTYEKRSTGSDRHYSLIIITKDDISLTLGSNDYSFKVKKTTPTSSTTLYAALNTKTKEIFIEQNEKYYKILKMNNDLLNDNNELDSEYILTKKI